MSNLYMVGPGGNRCGGGAGCCFHSPCLDAEENITGSHPITPQNLVVSEQIHPLPDGAIYLGKGDPEERSATC